MQKTKKKPFLTFIKKPPCRNETYRQTFATVKSDPTGIFRKKTVFFFFFVILAYLRHRVNSILSLFVRLFKVRRRLTFKKMDCKDYAANEISRRQCREISKTRKVRKFTNNFPALSEVFLRPGIGGVEKKKPTVFK